jgi:hypothetical protein
MSSLSAEGLPSGGQPVPPQRVRCRIAAEG